MCFCAKFNKSLNSGPFPSFAKGLKICEKYSIDLLYSTYSKLSIIRPGRSRLLEFEKKNRTGLLIKTFFQISRPGRLIEPKHWP